MEYLNICQVCCFCKKGSHVFKVDLKCFDDITGEVIINPIQAIHSNFQCQFCLHTSVLDFKELCPPSCVLHLKQSLKKKKDKMQQLVQQLTSLAFEE